MRNNLHIIIGVLLTLAWVMSSVSCSTTSKLAADEVLYTGVKEFKVKSAEGEKVPSEVEGYLFDIINVKPNNSLYSPYMRTPFPVGLWVYNHWDYNPKNKFKHWFYDRLVSQPVVIDNVNPALRVEMMKSVLDNNGFFAGSTRYELLPDKKNPKKAKLSYFVELGSPYKFSSVEYTGGKTEIEQIIDSLARRSKYYRVGECYNTDSLSAVRSVIASQLRELGYYYFRPEYIEYLADTTIVRGSVAIRMALADNAAPSALKKYYIGEVKTTVSPYFGRGVPDTVQTRRGMLIKMMPVKLRDGLIPSCLRFRTGRLVRVKDIDDTQMNLSRLGIFSSIDIAVTPQDSLNGRDTIDFNISCTMDRPMETSLEFQFVSKSSSYVGPGIAAGLTHKNIFGGGEQLTTQLTASYEWQTAGGSDDRSDVFNSYEFGVKSTLAFPRLLAPKFVDRSRRYINWTKISLSADVLNRPHYFKMVQFGTGFSWDWHTNSNSYNEFTPFKLTYTKMLSTTTAFDDAMADNPVIALSFRDQFIPMMSYSYTYDKKIDKNNYLNWNISVMEAGNIFSGIWSLAGKTGTKTLFGTPFSQFVKAQSQFIYGCRLYHGANSKEWMVFRVYAGAAHAYGNSSQVPYTEQFYIGGANSLRAFSVRSIGPGSYHPEATVKNGYYDQTGTFKFEFNTEFRFPIWGYLHGALFLDAGNIWLLKKDSSRPGGAIGEGDFFKEIALGTGAGLRFDVGMLVLRADLGVGIHAPYDTGKQGYYNMTSFKNSLAFHIALGYPF